MKAVSSPRPLFAAIFAIATAAAAFGQTTIDVNSVTRLSNGSGGYTYSTWKPLLGWDGNPLMDPVYDQQTGQPQADFVSSSPGGVATPGFFIQFGQINGVDTLAFRILLNEYRTGSAMPNIFLGLEGNDNDGGKADLFMTLSQQSNQLGLAFQAPGTGANTSPNTTTLGNPFVPAAQYYAGGVRPSNLPALNSNGNAIAFSSSNFSNIQLQDGVVDDDGKGAAPADNRSTYYPGWTTQAEASKLKLDSMVTFAIPLADINAALASLGETWTVTPDRLMLWIAATATQTNSVNQDAYGTNKVGFDSAYTSFLPYMDAYGRPIPEPATFGLCFGAGLAGFLGLRRRPARPRAA